MQSNWESQNLRKKGISDRIEVNVKVKLTMEI